MASISPFTSTSRSASTDSALRPSWYGTDVTTIRSPVRSDSRGTAEPLSRIGADDGRKTPGKLLDRTVRRDGDRVGDSFDRSDVTSGLRRDRAFDREDPLDHFAIRLHPLDQDRISRLQLVDGQHFGLIQDEHVLRGVDGNVPDTSLRGFELETTVREIDEDEGALRGFVAGRRWRRAA